MDFFVSTALRSRQANSYWEFTASDLMLDQMEKQMCTSVTSSSWIEIIVQYCTIVLSTLVKLLMGDFSAILEQPKTGPVLVDAACQTEDELDTELTVNRDWHPCHVSKGCDIDDNHSDTTEVTELITDTEDDDFEDAVGDEWEDLSSSAGDMLQSVHDAHEKESDCGCETWTEQLGTIVCTERGEGPSSIHVKDYLCSCGECPQYKKIAHDVTAKASQCTFLQKDSITRLLQAFSTYNEAIGYRTDMISTASACLQVWCGDEDKAFKSFITLYDINSSLCAPECTAQPRLQTPTS